MSRAAEIRAGHRQGTDLVILDIEFGRSGQVKEVTLIEHVSGRVLLDTSHIGQAPSTSGAISIEISLEKRFNRSVVVQEARFFWYKYWSRSRCLCYRRGPWRFWSYKRFCHFGLAFSAKMSWHRSRRWLTTQQPLQLLYEHHRPRDFNFEVKTFGYDKYLY